MGSLEVIFGTIVVVLAALAVIGALAFAITWEVCAIRRTLADRRHRKPDPNEQYWRDLRALTEPK
jgi:hypothetical protein